MLLTYSKTYTISESLSLDVVEVEKCKRIDCILKNRLISNGNGAINSREYFF